MTYRCFDVEIAGNIAHLKMKRGAELNTMVPEFWKELPEIVRDIDDHARARVIVISSTGKHFTGGMDLAVFTSNTSFGTTRGTMKNASSVASACDCRYATEDAFFIV